MFKRDKPQEVFHKDGVRGTAAARFVNSPVVVTGFDAELGRWATSKTSKTDDPTAWMKMNQRFVHAMRQTVALYGTKTKSVKA